MRAFPSRLSWWLSLCLSLVAPAVFAHDVTITGTQTFSSLDGSASDHDGLANGVFTVNDGNLVVNGVVNCNDDGPGHSSACAMTFIVSGNLTINAGGALYAENRTGSGSGGNITIIAGGNLALNGNAIVSSAARHSSASTGGAITASAGGAVTMAAGSTIDSGAANARGGAIAISAGGFVNIDGNILSGPSRTILATRLTGEILSGGTGNQIGGAISIASSSFAEPAVVIGENATIASQGEKDGAGPVTINGCGIEVRGLVAAVSRKDAVATVALRSGKNLLVDGRDLGGAGMRRGRVRADATADGANDDRVDLLARGSVTVLGPSSAGTLFAVSSLPGPKNKKDAGGTIRVMALEGTASASGRALVAGADGKGTRGGTISIESAGNVNLDTATIVAVGDATKPKKDSAGGHITARSYSGNVLWSNGTGDVRPIGSASGIPLADQGTIILTACGTVSTLGSSYPANGVPTGVFPETHTLVCSPAAPSLPIGEPPLVTCNTPPVANDATATTNEDTPATIALSGSDVDGDSLTFSIVSGPSHGTLGAIIPTGPTTATVDYTPALDSFGPDSFVYRADDGNGGTDDATVTITVNPVNDAPSFLIGPTDIVLEDSGPRTYVNWVTAISPGPANESSQTVTFAVTNDNNALFSVQPAVAPNGTLTYTPAPNANGTALITVVAHDDGGTANGGVDSSGPQMSNINVTAVNDEPSFTSGGNVTANEDSGAHSAPWATGISAGPANESSQSVTFVTSNDNNALFAVQPGVSPSGVLTFTPAASAFGSATVTVYLTDDGGTSNGGDNTSPSQTFTITVNAVNDAPSFTSGGDVTVNEDSGAYSAAWATAISAGPANESSQTVTFNVTNGNNALFSVQPSVSSSGVLTFVTAPDAFGSALVTIYAQDDGGTANGGVDVSPSQMFTITVNAVNDAPSFASGGDVTVNEDSGPYSTPWATGISAGPANESGQTVAFLVSNNNSGLFLVQPSISPAGALTFTSAPNAFGSAIVTVALHDDGGTANGGVDTSASVQFTITVNAVNDAPTAVTDSWETLGNTELRVDFAGGLTPKIVDTTASGNGARDNDSDVEGDPFTVTAIVGCGDATAPFDCTLADGSVLSMNANGSFSFTPGPGITSSSFQYTITDSPSFGTPASSNGTVNIVIHDRIWYVNGSAAAGGNGTSIAPFNSFATLNGPGGAGDADGPNDTIFVHDSTVIGGIGLEANQKLWGQGIGLSTAFNLNGNGSPQVLVAPGTKARIFAGASDAVSVTGVTGVDIAGLDLKSVTGNGVDVTSLAIGPGASASIHDNVVSDAAQEGIDVNAGSASGTTVMVSNTSIVSNGNGFDVSGVGPATVSYTNGTINSTGGLGIRMDGTASGNLTITGLANVTIDGNTAGVGISIATAKFDAVPGGTFDTVNGGTIAVGSSGNPVGGAGIVVSGASGDLAITSLNVFGATSGVSVAGTGLFTGAAGMRLTNGGGSISAPAGDGLTVTNATIGAGNLNFTSISATGGTNGITLNNTGSAGGLIVSGTGVANSGGTIHNAAIGVSLTSTSATSLSYMNLHDFTDFAIRGTTVSNFSMSNTTIAGTNGNNAAADEGSVTFSGLTGSASISSSSISGGFENNFTVINSSGTLNRITFNGVTIGPNSTTDGNDGIYLEAQNAALLNATIQNSFFTSARGDLFQLNLRGSSKSDLVFTGNALSNNHPAIASGGGGVTISGGDNTTATGVTLTYDISNNTFRDASGHGVLIVKATDPGSFSGTFNNNSIGVAAVADSGSLAGSGLKIQNAGNGSVTAAITNNLIRQYNNFGIELLSGGSATPQPGNLFATVTGNTVSNPGTGGLPMNGIHLNGGTVPGDLYQICLKIGGAGALANSITGSGANGGTDFRLRQRQATTVRLPGYAGAATATAAVVAFVQSNNGGTPSGLANVNSPPGGGFIGTGTSCP
jgi:hypothetical protein